MNQKYNQLTIEEKILLNSEIQKRSKNTVVAWMLWTFLNCIGAHRYYLDKKNSAFIMTILTLTVIGIPITMIWGFLDIFNIPAWLKEEKQNKENEIIDEILNNRNNIVN